MGLTKKRDIKIGEHIGKKRGFSRSAGRMGAKRDKSDPKTL